MCKSAKSADVAPLQGFVTVLIPCRNEAATIANCVREAFDGLRNLGEKGEVLVSDNGSTDDSAKLAAGVGARIVHCPNKGYGNAVRFGVNNARGEIVVMADADGSYDFRAIEPFVRSIQAGADLVIGNRFAGGILPGAMPWKNRYIGNPVLSTILKVLYRSSVNDAHCGMRGFTRAAHDRMRLQSTGMEFASEQVVRAIKVGLKVVEVPVVLRPDGRDGSSHLRPWRDGCRHLTLMVSHLFRRSHPVD